MKKLVALVVALVLALSCTAVFAEAKSEYDVRVLVWKFDDAYGSSVRQGMDKWAEKVQAGGDCMATLTFGDIVQKGRDVIEYKDMLDLADYDFEGHKFPGVRDYDKYLTLWYGDYMQLPPEDQRVSIHTTEVYWKD